MYHIKEALDNLIHGNRECLDAFLLDVCRDMTIDETKAEMHIYMLRLDGNNRPRIEDFSSFLSERIVDYCIPESEIMKAKKLDEENHTSSNTIKLYKKAQNLFTDINNSGEGGELLLSVLTQSILQIPQVLCKMPLKTNSEVHFHGADGLYGDYDIKSQKFLLYWGESKLYTDIDDALTKCFDSIKCLLTEEGAIGTQRERDLMLFRDNIDFNNEEFENVILSFLDPDNADYTKLEYRGICLVGYNEDAYPHDLSGIEQNIKAKIQSRITEFESKILSRLKYRTPLDAFVLHVFLIPFSDVEAFRNSFVEAVKCH